MDDDYWLFTYGKTRYDSFWVTIKIYSYSYYIITLICSIKKYQMILEYLKNTI